MKYSEELTNEICQYLREGDSQKLAAQKAGIAEDTFYEWMNTKTEFSERVKRAKEEFRATIVGKLEASLWKRATGYEVTETEIEYVSGKDGEPRIKGQKTKKKHIIPDTGALIFALSNLAPEKWVNKQRVDTREITKEESELIASLEKVPKEVLCDIADLLQDAEVENG